MESFFEIIQFIFGTIVFFVIILGLPVLVYFLVRRLVMIFSRRSYIEISHITKELRAFVELIENGIETYEDWDIIILKINSIKILLSKLDKIRISFSSNYTAYAEIDDVRLATLHWLMPILNDLRSDLSSRLTEQQKTLESAKSEVEKNIGGTSGLEQVSEAQKARLDRQIEQFEELQRVLVKV